jgi:hypothetical protein
VSLLEEIQNEAVDTNSDLGSLLRKCKVLASRLGSQPLENWLVWESNGYPDDAEIPNYRIWPLHVKGHFSGPFGSGMRNVQIPTICLPKEAREQYRRYECKQSIASIEQMLKGSKEGVYQVSTGDLAVVLGSKVYRGQNCIQAWAEFSASNLYELLNAVRNRILDFSLAIWKEKPSAGDLSKPSEGNVLEPSKVTQIFYTTVYGGTANLLGNVIESKVSLSVIHNDITSLENVLRDNGVIDEDLERLRAAIESDDKPNEKDRFGPRVSSWIESMIKKALDGGWKVGIGTAGALLAHAISKYYGL